MADTSVSIEAGWVAVLGGAHHWSQAPATLYIEELLAQAGLLNWRWIGGCEELADPAIRVVVIPNGKLLLASDIEPLRQFMAHGGRMLALGRPGPLDAMFGVRPQPPIREGWLLPGESMGGRMQAAWRVPLHVFDLVHLLPDDTRGRVSSGNGHPAAPLMFSVGNHNVSWPVSATVEIGAGSGLLIAADLPASVVRIQQGLAIFHDGEPAPDGTADINDGILKCDDSIMLDWTRDRQKPVESLPPIFLQPQCDLIRELLIAAIEDLAEAARLPLVRLDCWPRNLPAVGLISHDSDLNESDKVRFQMQADSDADVAATWCIMSGTSDGAIPEYSPEALAAIAASGHEIALNYDARTDHPDCRWGPHTLELQLDRLRQRIRSIGCNAAIQSNRNYFCRWQGRLEMFRWLIEVGIRVDQTKGGSKTGCLGWPFGSCHPWRPMDDEVSPPYLMKMLEISFATADLGGLRCPQEFGRHYVDVAHEHGGVASLQFHPWQSDQEALRASLAEHVAYGRSKGLEWWTARQIAGWQFARRAVRVASIRQLGRRLVLQADLPPGLEGATLTLTGPVQTTVDLDAAASGQEIAITI
ncbi:MAG: hypothetical protein PHU85_15970 [Phycisphaerae bacterium]|nr:hypothetical protein [Phycisphaerae bacterium]